MFRKDISHKAVSFSLYEGQMLGSDGHAEQTVILRSHCLDGSHF